MSDYVVHFTKPTGTTTAYDVMIKILSTGRINAATPFGNARKLEELGDSQKSACFSEIPLDLLQRLIERRSLYGVGFHQRIVVARGGARVWYVDLGTPTSKAFQEIVTGAMKGRINATDPIWKLTPFVDTPGVYASGRYQFEWEREWRLPGGLTFDAADVAFLFIPEELHASALSFFERAQSENLGPAYFCPYVDPRWNMERIQAALMELEPGPDADSMELEPGQEAYGMCGYCGNPTEDGLCGSCGMLS